MQAINVIYTVSDSLLKGIAPLLFAPLPGVVVTVIERVAGVEELTDRYRHARTALAVPQVGEGVWVCRC